jgi:flavin reductase (DIM6/NTAB) family NADH-FMN oxidoreductase RutF
MHVQREPNILYFGTPVALLSTCNEDGAPNMAPMSSIFFLSWRCLLGLAANSKTTANLRRTRELVINLPSVDQVSAVDRLARTTGSDPVPANKIARGYRYEKGKFEIAGLTPVPSETVAPPRIAECPVQLEAQLEAEHSVDVGGPLEGAIITFEIRIRRVFIEESLMMEGHPNRVDPDKWRPLMFSFQEFYGLGPKVHPSTLGQISETLYRTPDTGGLAATPS